MSDATFVKSPKVFRDILKESRDGYFVEYHCAQPPYCALLNLTFPERARDHGFVRERMEHELNVWLKRYPVPVMVHGVDEREDMVRFSSDYTASSLMGYVVSGTSTVVSRWGLLRDAELPTEQLTPEYLAGIYVDVPFRLASEVLEKATREMHRRIRAANVILFFFVVVPVLIEIVALGIDWLGHVMAATSIGIGCYKAAKTFGWLKRSARDEEKAAENLRMRHHHYHCEKNPAAFEKLRAENFVREAEERVRRDAEALQKEANRYPRPER